MKILSCLERYSRLSQVPEQLFAALAKVAKEILKINVGTKEGVSDVMEAEVQFEIGDTRKLEKNVLMEIEGVHQLKVTIVRDGDREDHILGIVRESDRLVVKCPTADTDKGKELELIATKGDEYVIGMSNDRTLNRLNDQLLKATKVLEKAKRNYDLYGFYSEASSETVDAEWHLNRAKDVVDSINMDIAKFDDYPILQWFTAEDSEDISQEQIILKLTDDEKIVLTDEGDKCSATVTRIS